MKKTFMHNITHTQTHKDECSSDLRVSTCLTVKVLKCMLFMVTIAHLVTQPVLNVQKIGNMKLLLL